MFNQQSVKTDVSSGVDQGLRAHFLKVYNYMASAMILTGLVAYFASQSQTFLSMLFNEAGGRSPLGWIVMFAPLGFVMFFSMRIHRMSQAGAQMAFWAFSVLMGLSLFYVFIAFTGESIARVFFITAGTFGTMSLYGYTTNRDLTKLGSFLMMGMIGLFIGFLVNAFFIESTAMHYAMSAIGVLIFVGLTAYDTQRIKQQYYALAGYGDALGKAAIMGALQLYLDFINLFIMLLQFFGQER